MFRLGWGGKEKNTPLPFLHLPVRPVHRNRVEITQMRLAARTESPICDTDNFGKRSGENVLLLRLRVSRESARARDTRGRIERHGVVCDEPDTA